VTDLDSLLREADKLGTLETHPYALIPELAAAVRELRERQQKIQAFVDAQSNDPALWCEAVHISEAYLQQALRKLHACIDGEDISWLEHGD
jgi:hypothetical protein